jgi:2-succinyl-5-enolpyruvyl-6-hydroxy-3-cyclohexene-1-carboxylate synthase
LKNLCNETVNEFSVNSTIDTFIPEQPISAIDVEKYAAIWNKATRKMVLVGVADPNALNEQT